MHRRKEPVPPIKLLLVTLYFHAGANSITKWEAIQDVTEHDREFLGLYNVARWVYFEGGLVVKVNSQNIRIKFRYSR